MKLTIDQVRALQVGERVDIIKETPAGPKRFECTVACRDGRKFLTFRAKGALLRCFIEDYPGATYSKGGFST